MVQKKIALAQRRTRDFRWYPDLNSLLSAMGSAKTGSQIGVIESLDGARAFGVVCCVW